MCIYVQFEKQNYKNMFHKDVFFLIEPQPYDWEKTATARAIRTLNNTDLNNTKSVLLTLRYIQWRN